MSSNGKVAFSLGGKKKKKASTQAAKDTAAAFGHDSRAAHQDDPSSDPDKPQAPLVIPLSQPTQSLLTRVKQEETTDNNNDGVKQEDAVAEATPSSSDVKHDPDAPVISSGGNANQVRQAAQQQYPGDGSKDQLKRDLQQLPDQADDEQYAQVPISSFGAALLRGMGWDEKDDKTGGDNTEPGMPRPHRLGLGAIPKAPAGTGDEHMPSVLSGRNKKKRKLSVQQLQQQEEFERQRKLQLQQDKQRTRQNGSIVFIPNSFDNHRRAKIVQLQGVPGLNMVLVQFERDAEPTPIKKGELGELVGRPELEERPFMVPEPKKKKLDNGKDRNNNGREEARRDRSKSPDERGRRRRDRDEREDDRRSSRRDRSRSRSRDRYSDERKSDRKRDRRHRERSRSRDRHGDERKSDRKRDRRDRERSRSRDRHGDERKSDRKRDRDRSGSRDRYSDDKSGKRRRGGDRYADDEQERGREENQSRKRSKSDRDIKQDDSNPLWIIPNIRVRVVTEKLGKKHFRHKGVVVDVTRRHGATLRMDQSEGNGNSVVLEHVPERYLETALPKVGGNAIVLTGSNKWTKGILLERDSKTSKGAIQVFEDMSTLTLSLDDLAEWCGPLDDTLG